MWSGPVSQQCSGQRKPNTAGSKGANDVVLQLPVRDRKLLLMGEPVQPKIKPRCGRLPAEDVCFVGLARLHGKKAESVLFRLARHVRVPIGLGKGKMHPVLGESLCRNGRERRLLTPTVCGRHECACDRRSAERLFQSDDDRSAQSTETLRYSECIQARELYGKVRSAERRSSINPASPSFSYQAAMSARASTKDTRASHFLDCYSLWPYS
jgi:hypothetical protein